MDVLRYRTRAGADPVGKYLDGVAAREAADVLDAIVALEEHGLDAAVNTRQVRGRLWEIKVGDHRIFFVVISGPRLVLLHGYRKRAQKAPPREIETALTRMKEVLEND
jgi:phage-related protein